MSRGRSACHGVTVSRCARGPAGVVLQGRSAPRRVGRSVGMSRCRGVVAPSAGVPAPQGQTVGTSTSCRRVRTKMTMCAEHGHCSGDWLCLVSDPRFVSIVEGHRSIPSFVCMSLMYPNPL